jgi:DNA mismatch repair protein MutS2
VLNAAAGVDELTLAPNYQLRLGVPGASAGIQTAERLGLNAASSPPPASASARSRWTSPASSTSCTTNSPNSKRTARPPREQYALNQERARLAREGDVELRNRTRELETKLASLLKDFEFQMRETVRAIEDRAAQQKLSKEAERRILRLRREFQESFNQTVVAHRTGADVGDANAQPHMLKHVAPGDQVRLKSMNKIAVVQREVEKDLFEVALGPIKMRVKRDDSASRSPPPRFSRQSKKADPLAAARKQKNVHVTVTSANTDDMRMEINLIGRTVDEATEELEKYLDRAFLAGLPRVRIIHGHGAASSAAASANS